MGKLTEETKLRRWGDTYGGNYKKIEEFAKGRVTPAEETTNGRVS